MKKIMYSIILVLITLSGIIAQEKKTIWDYPVKPGYREWAAFTTGQQMIDACQIPNKVLKALTTGDLAEICLNYPLRLDYKAYSDDRFGVSIIIENFNGFKELTNRKDGMVELMKIYKNFPIATTLPLPVSRDYTIINLPFLETLLSDNNFIAQLDQKQIEELGKIVLEKYVKKIENKDLYGLNSIKSTFLLGSIILKKQNSSMTSISEINTIDIFLRTYDNVEPNLYSEISKIISKL